MTQATLFDKGPIKSSIEGLVYEPEFLSLDEEKELIGTIQTLPLHAARYKQYLARRRVVSFGGSYDFDANRLLSGTHASRCLFRSVRACRTGSTLNSNFFGLRAGLANLSHAEANS
jgi:hypothetical protein